MESRETNNDCSLDLSPNPDVALFGNREESEEESSSAESEDDSEIEAGSDASSRDSAPETNQEVEPSRGWSPLREVTPRVRRPGGTEGFHFLGDSSLTLLVLTSNSAQ